MSDLLEDRLASTPPFQNVGIDVFGPYNISNGSSTRRIFGTYMKIWVLIFVCSPSHAIHLEPLDGLDTVSFSPALRRFVSLRGTCKLIRSDRGTNFIGAKKSHGKYF